MKVVLSGYYGFHNVGDEAILYSIIAALRKSNEDIGITVLSNDPEYTRKTYGVEAVNRWKLKEVMAAIRESDGLISGGGSLLQDKTGNRSVIYYSGVMLIAKFVGKQFVVYAQGIGPVEKKQNQWITKYALSKASLLTVRDVASMNFLKDIGVRQEIKLVPDPVLGIEVGDRVVSWIETSGVAGKKFISVSVRDWPSTVDYLGKIAVVLDKLVIKGYAIVFIPMHGEIDEETSKKVQGMMVENSVVAPSDLSIEEKIKVIGKSELLVGMRLHALIFAAVMERPFTAISYDPKINAFAELCQQPVAAHVNEGNWSEETLLSVVTEQLNQLPEYEQKVKNYADKAKATAQQTAALAVDTFSGVRHH